MYLSRRSSWLLAAVGVAAVVFQIIQITQRGQSGAVYRPCGAHDDFALVSSRVLFTADHDDTTVQPAAVLVRGGRIHKVVPLTLPVSGSAPLLQQAQQALAAWLPTGAAIHDHAEMVIMPGLIDSHVHIDEPGRTHWEGMESATRAAAAGGITTVVDMPLNSDPSTTTPQLMQQKVNLATGRVYVNIGFWAGLVPDNAGDHSALRGMLAAGALGFKSFMSPAAGFPHVTAADLVRALPVLMTEGVPLYVHTELANDTQAQGDRRRHATWLESRRTWEQDAFRNLTATFCAAAAGLPRAAPGYRFHLAHLSDADLLPDIQAAKAAGPWPLSGMTVETCPHFLTFASEDVPDGDTRHKCAPPLRERANRERLWAALADGSIDSVASDHSPAPRQMRLPEEGDFVKAWAGIAGLQYGLPVTWTGFKAHGLGLERLAEVWSAAPAKLAGLAHHKGAIREGFDADIVVWSPEAEADTSPDAMRHRFKETPYTGMNVLGRVVATYVLGHQVFGADDVAGVSPQHACGAVLSREPTSNRDASVSAVTTDVDRLCDKL